MNAGEWKKPVPTVFNGIRYRSRLEASWGLLWHKFFRGYDCLYEPDVGRLFGCSLSVDYTPDLWLGVNFLECFQEIKPAWPSEAYLARLRLIAEELSREPFCKPILLTVGSFRDDTDIDVHFYPFVETGLSFTLQRFLCAVFSTMTWEHADRLVQEVTGYRWDLHRE